MSVFSGFSGNTSATIPLPDAFLESILPQLDNTLEINLALYAFWALKHQDGNTRYLTSEDFYQAPEWVTRKVSPKASRPKIDNALQKFTQIGFLLSFRQEGAACPLYFLNSVKGKALYQSCQQGLWQPGETERLFTQPVPTIYQLYEENIGPLTPLIADLLIDSEKTCSAEWVREAIEIAVKNNVRNWRYIEAILRSWQKDGRNAENKRNYEESYRQYFPDR